jgi:hypothetical protein
VVQTSVPPPTHPRTAPELSDVALFACAAAALWFVRRALRRRLPRRSERD